MLPTLTRIFACTEPVDMRRSFEKLARCAREVLQHDPSSGALFISRASAGNDQHPTYELTKRRVEYRWHQLPGKLSW